MNLMPSKSDLSTDTRDAVLEKSRKSMHRNVRRKYDTYVVCERCHNLHLVSSVTVSYLCHKCGKYNSVTEAVERYNSGEFDYENKSSDVIAAPTIRSGDGREYSNLRDEMEIRADLFKNGISRPNLGVDKFNKILKKELVKNKCYRGPEKTGV